MCWLQSRLSPELDAPPGVATADLFPTVALTGSFGTQSTELSNVLNIINELAGLQRDIAAAAVGWALARFAFEFDYTVAPWVFVLGIGGGVACALAGGWLGLRNVLKSPPLATLREA